MGPLNILLKLSFLLKLEIDGETYTVLKCSYNSKKLTGCTTKPNGETNSEKIKLILESCGNVSFLEWIIAPDQNRIKVQFHSQKLTNKLSCG